MLLHVRSEGRRWWRLRDLQRVQLSSLLLRSSGTVSTETSEASPDFWNDRTPKVSSNALPCGYFIHVCLRTYRKSCEESHSIPHSRSGRASAVLVNVPVKCVE